jgi:hypothetical protein
MPEGGLGGSGRCVPGVGEGGRGAVVPPVRPPVPGIDGRGWPGVEPMVPGTVGAGLGAGAVVGLGIAGGGPPAGIVGACGALVAVRRAAVLRAGAFFLAAPAVRRAVAFLAAGFRAALLLAGLRAVAFLADLPFADFAAAERFFVLAAAFLDDLLVVFVAISHPRKVARDKDSFARCLRATIPEFVAG